MLSQDAIEQILGIKPKTDLTIEQMASKLTFTFFPYNREKCSQDIFYFSQLLKKTFIDLKIRVINYEDALERVPFSKICKRFFKIILNNIIYIVLQVSGRNHGYYFVHLGALVNLMKIRRIKKGITTIALGTNPSSYLPIDFTSSFTQNSIITILDCPSNINENSNFDAHFDLAMNAFSYHMTHLAIFVDSKKWIVYNFNASHPVYPLNENFTKNVLESIIPKIAAPIRPPILKEFICESEAFDIEQEPYKTLISDFIKGSKLFNQTNLYPKGKRISELPFRNGFYRWIGKIHLDHRSGMSYGFLARQLPSKIDPLIPYTKLRPDQILAPDLIRYNKCLYILVEIPSGRYWFKLPPVWVLSQRSGSNKTQINPSKDIILLGLHDGKLYLKTSKGSPLRKDYKPSFDTKVILAHALGNAIIAAIIQHEYHNDDGRSKFALNLVSDGAAIIHWHGYLNRSLIPNDWTIHGFLNPHVACSTPQSAIYALAGKLDAFNNFLKNNRKYGGDVHIEPHHGSNVTSSSLEQIAHFLVQNPEVSKLGNLFLKYYQNKEEILV